MRLTEATTQVMRRLDITEAEYRRLLWDPVFCAKAICGYDLDPGFQSARLRTEWLTPFTIDSSGYNTGKTLGSWLYCVDRAILIPNQRIAVFYPTSATGRNSFWEYFNECRHPVFQGQLGKLSDDENEEGKKISQDSACFKAFFKGGSQIWLPAPNFSKGSSPQASQRYNVVKIEEWTHVDNDAAGAKKISGIDAQLIGRANRPAGCWNQHHPLWANHIHLSAPAKPRAHPAYRRYREALKRANGIRSGGGYSGGGDPHCAVYAFCYKDWSGYEYEPGVTFAEKFRDDANVEALRSALPPAEFAGEALGLWEQGGTGWYTDEAIAACQALGRDLRLLPVINRAMDLQENLNRS